MGKDLLETKKWPCEATYQKFHPKILILGIFRFLQHSKLIPEFQLKHLLLIWDVCKT